MCLQQLDIGGVETAVLTLCKGYIRAGAKVYVAAKRGLFNKQLEELGVNFFEIEYEIKNKYVLERQEELMAYCKENKITEIHIHQYPCVIYWLPVIMQLKIPYVAYVHSIIPGAPEWFMATFPVYKTALPIFFENASKVVCIAESTRNDIDALFHLDKDKYLIIPNSLNMEDFKTTKEFKEIKTFGLIARLSEEKIPSIKAAIAFFKEFSKEKQDAKFLIAGSGPMLNDLKQYAKDCKNVTFIGSITNSKDFMEKIDLYLGVDRTILEAIACHKIAIISSYKGLLTLVNKDNIEQASLQNFSGNNLTETKDLLSQINSLTKTDYQKITTANYKYVNEKYNVDKNLYTDILTNNYTNDYRALFESINNYLEELTKLNYELYTKKENTFFKRLKRFIKRILSKIKRLITK